MSADGQSNGMATESPQPTGSVSRFERRWRLVGAGLSNVWRFGDLELPVASGRLLLRGPNGTGKTTALEALAPYVLDLNAARMSAGKARTTNLSSLMREGAAGRRRFGYTWLTLAEPQQGIWSFGVRIQYSDGASPPVRVMPFAVPGRPLHELKIHGVARAPLTSEQFAESVAACGGEVFEGEEAYVAHLAARLFGTPHQTELVALTARLRQIRNPAILGDVSPQAAADALRESLPGVDEDVVSATADALAESDATREAFTRDQEAAELLEDFRGVWCAHATEIVSNAHAAAVASARELRTQVAKVRRYASDLETASVQAAEAKRRAEDLDAHIVTTRGELEALEKQQDYRAAGRLGELKKTAAALQRTANAAADAMRATAQGISAELASLQRELENTAEDLEEQRSQARSADAEADQGTPLLKWTVRARAPLRVGGIVAEAGPELVIHGNAATLREIASSWLELAQGHAHRSDAAALAIADYKPVEILEHEVNDRARVARETAAASESESNRATRATAAAQSETHTLLSAIRLWVKQNPQLTESVTPSADEQTTDGSREIDWGAEEVEQLAGAEPAQVLITCDTWATHAATRAQAIAAEFRARAKQAAAHAATLRVDALALRKEAIELRSGRLLPLPRPEWAGHGDDTVALGTALEWQPGCADPMERARLEAAMAAAGLLGADAGERAASTPRWRVEPTGPICPQNLTELIAVDPGHPLASTASAVLARVCLAPSALLEPETDGIAALCIGRDGTFRGGVLHGRVAGADEPASLAPAIHIGARQRRAAALARAQLLDDQAAQIEAQAETSEEAAAQLNRDADSVSQAGQSFPSREALRAVETRRIEIARIAREAHEAATIAQAHSERATIEHKSAYAEWLDRTRSRGLPSGLDQLAHMRDQGAQSAEALRRAAGPLTGKLAERLDRMISGYSAEEIARSLISAESAAQDAFLTATETHTAVRVLEEAAGAAIADILARHERTQQHLSHLLVEHGPANSAQIESAKAQATAQQKVDEAQRQLQEEVQPHTARQLVAMRTLLEVPGVADAVLDGELPAQDERLLDQVATKTQGRKTLTTRTVLERADDAKAKLAGVWSLDPGENFRELLTFVLTYRDGTYTPIEAALYAQKLKTRAQQALDASEEHALREFVIGRLPNAVGTAWTRLHDWVIEVNRKMQSAAASSGVAVQVRIPLRQDLAAASRDVYELSCKVSSAERTPEQQRRLGEALHSLLTAAPGETMQERVASAVDIRDWVEVYYEVTRPGGTKQRWSSKTGLSGGERRLVVLAPMLAAIAAGYDRLGPKALRLVTLDEVPAEVDERGREGLARYIAELDLDLICTSYLWDGCPGAWDGIDAYDLEAGVDSTVVAFPMLVRGASPIPEVLEPESKSADPS
jgi:hypothetical protein